MEQIFKYAASTIFIGIGATAILDIWILGLKALKVPTMNFALLGRWVGHIPLGRWKHERIASARPIRGEVVLGWAAHYAIGIAFAALLVSFNGAVWLEMPRLAPALITGLVTAVAPLFIMQPAMGGGVAFTRTPTPMFNCLKSLVNHGVFGFGLYLAAVILVILKH